MRPPRGPVQEIWTPDSSSIEVRGARNVLAFLGALALPVVPPVGTENPHELTSRIEDVKADIRGRAEAIKDREGSIAEFSIPREQSDVVFLALQQHRIHQSGLQGEKAGPVKRWLTQRRVNRMLIGLSEIVGRPPFSALTHAQVRQLR